MPVHNARPFLDASISSILDQTFPDFEFVILNDASTDGSDRALRDWEKRDARIRVIESKRKLGLAGSSNLVVSTSRAEIVARMDADDVSHPDRLSRQLQIMKNDSDVVVVGTLCDGIDGAGRRTRPRDRWRIMRRSRYIPFPHGSAMFRRNAFDRVGGYHEELVYGEDQNFFFRMTHLGRVVTLPDVLYHFRYHTENTTVLNDSSGMDLASLYLLGSMRLWSGHDPGISPEMVTVRASGFSWQTIIAIASASLGTLSPALLRFVLRSLIRARDAAACLRIKDGRPYEWRLK